MEVFLDKGLKDLNDNEIFGVNQQAATLKGLSIDALCATFKDEEKLSGEDKLKRYELALKIKNSSEPATLSAEEVTLIKKLISKAYGTIIVGQAWTMLEGQ